MWTDSTNGAAGRVHVRDLVTGEESSFDPQLGERCNLLGFDVEGGRIAMSQYCGTYDGGVRDDRVQVVTTEGELRLSDAMSSWTVAHGPAPGDQFFWTTPTGAPVPGFGSKGATGHLGEIIR